MYSNVEYGPRFNIHASHHRDYQQQLTFGKDKGIPPEVLSSKDCPSAFVSALKTGVSEIMSEEVLELSIEETNVLRAKLGLKPLRLKNTDHDVTAAAAASSSTLSNTNDNNGQQKLPPREGEEEVLELSVNDTNALRARLGLAPLRVDGGGGIDVEASNSKIIHKPAENQRELQEAQERVLRAKLQRDVDRGIAKVFGSSTLASRRNSGTEKDDDGDDEDGGGALSWAAKMRGASKASDKKKKEKKKSDKEPQPTRTGSSSLHDEDKSRATEAYSEKDLEGITVAHNLSDLQAGTTTILTLADDTLLETKESTTQRTIGLKESGGETLQNVNMVEQQLQQDGLQKKRQYELGAGRAGGYAGYDDDEFSELGGTQGPSRVQRGAAGAHSLDHGTDDLGKGGGFRIGIKGENDGVPLSDLEAIQRGKAISLVPLQADVAASDFMTLEEEQEEKAKRKKEKDGSFGKKDKKKKDKKKDKKKSKKQHRRKQQEDSDEEEEMEDAVTKLAPATSNSLLDDLEETAVDNQPSSSSVIRKRRRLDDQDDEDDAMDDKQKTIKQENGATQLSTDDNKGDKRARYDAIMSKGNERTKAAFGLDKPKEEKRKIKEELLDDEPDDAFLNAALAKARRMNRLKELNQQKNINGDSAADSVAKTVMSIKMENEARESSSSASSSGKMSFAIDDTREFTRAMRARALQQQPKNKPVVVKTEDSKDAVMEDASETNRIKVESVKEAEEDEAEDMDMEELAKEVKPDEGSTAFAGLDGATADAVGVGRGLSAFVSMLRHTGEISSKHKKGGVEELRGRAKDERNYEHYKPVDLKKVVKISANATDKDKELANRDIKLEYRDKHGRLLTSKEAFRDLCYQFHGYGKSKRSEEKQLQQIAREQAEARLASRQVAAARDGTTAGTLGALKATQKATGKAFVVHKT
jgi:U4/U6.U5 tri-snRNP-associated protein 1